MEFTEEQIQELINVFRAEATGHINVLNGIFLTLKDEPDGDHAGVLEQAFREAHSIKGSAGTLGFERVEVVAHSMEDVLGRLKREEIDITTATVVLLIGALEAIRVASEESVPGDGKLTAEEKKQKKALDKLVGQEAGEDEESPEPAGSGEAVDSEETDQEQRLAEGQGTGAMDGLVADQIQQLVGVFQAESREHIKALAEVLFNIEEGAGDIGELLVVAFREAHSLKGSAGTLGFGRVEILTHGLEDVLGQLRVAGDQIEAQDIDLLLNALDLIHRAAKNSEMGDQALTADETRIIQVLQQRAEDLAEQQLKRTDFGKASEVPDMVTQPPAERPVTNPAVSEAQSDRESPVLGADLAVDKGQVQEEFIRIAESKLEAVIAQVGELFEANLKIESLIHEFSQFCVAAEEVVSMIDGLRVNFEGTKYESVLHATEEKARNLSIRLRGMTNRFDRDDRQMAKLIQGSQEELHKIRLAPVSTIFVMIRRQVREISKTTGKPLKIVLSGGEYALDRKVLDAMEEPISHILRNAADHGIEDAKGRKAAGKNETGRLSVAVHHTGDAVELTVADDGSGVDSETIRKSLVRKKILSESEASHLSSDQLFDYLFESGFSTHSGVSKISGRGVGLDVVKFTVERLGGEVRLETRKGEGTAITLRLPLVMSTVRCLLFRISNKVFAVPASNVEKVVIPSSEDVKMVGGGEVVVYDGQNVPLGSLSEILDIASDAASLSQGSRMVVIISFGERRFCFSVDELMEYTQVILKPLGDLLERVPNVSGISLLGTGEVALILNPADLVRAAGGGARGKSTKAIFQADGDATETRRVLVVDDSIATRTLEKTLLESAGFTVYTASDGYKALDVLSTTACDVVISDIQMPNMDGFELTRTIKGRPAFSYLPVILITSMGSDEDKARGMAAGADAYIIKRELTQQELIDTINQLL